MYTFSVIVGIINPESVKCIPSATELTKPKLAHRLWACSGRCSTRCLRLTSTLDYLTDDVNPKKGYRVISGSFGFIYVHLNPLFKDLYKEIIIGNPKKVGSSGSRHSIRVYV